MTLEHEPRPVSEQDEGVQPEPTLSLAPPSSGAAPTRTPSAGPLGSGDYVVRQGDCIESIAFTHGHFWETIWNHPDNQQLKSVRKDPNVLLAGDQVFVPDLRPKQESGATDQRHRFRRKGVPSKLCIVVEQEDQPRSHEPYRIEIDGQILSGKTDARGRIEHPIPPNAARGRLILGEGRDQQEYPLQLGCLDPVSEITGVQARLTNLGFDVGAIDGELGPETQQALRDFQGKHGLQTTGNPDQATRDTLVKAHGA